MKNGKIFVDGGLSDILNNIFADYIEAAGALIDYLRI
jgi:hypothetical protein